MSRSPPGKPTAMTSGKAAVPPWWRRPRPLILVGALVAVLIALVIATRSTTPRQPPGTKVFGVGNRVVLRFIHSAGSVHVRAGPAGQVRVTEHRSGFTDAIQTKYRQQGDAITVTVSIGTGLPVATWVDFDVAVPQDTTANVAVAAGTLTASGLTGNLMLRDTNGSIWATKVGGAVALHTTSGSINTSRVDGQVSAVTKNGTITAISTRLAGHSLVQAQSGTINFHGSLDPGSRTEFSNTNGATGITLPGGSSVVVDARASHGSINSQFSSVRVVSRPDGRVADGRLGRGDPARLRVRTVAGSIDLNHRV